MYKQLKLVKYIFIATILFIPLELFAYEKINGRACYRFSENETIAEARHVAEAMAIREALEGYSVFIQYLSKLESNSEKNDLIKIASSSLIMNTKLKFDEQLARKKICVEFFGEIDPFNFKQRIQSYLNKVKRNKLKDNLDLGENYWGKILKVEFKNKNLRIVVKCKYKFNYQRSECPSSAQKEKYLGAQVIIYDNDGIPDKEYVEFNECLRKGSIVSYNFSSIEENHTYELIETSATSCFE